MIRSASLNFISEALVNAQIEVSNVFRNTAGMHGDYANLEEILTTVKPVFLRHGLSILQVPSARFLGNPVGGELDWIGVETTLLHKSGEHLTWFTGSRIEARVSKRGHKQAHTEAIGATITYLRRYILMGLAGITQVNMTPEEEGETSSEFMQLSTPRMVNGLTATEMEDIRDMAKEARIIHKVTEYLRNRNLEHLSQICRDEGLHLLEKVWDIRDDLGANGESEELLQKIRELV